MTVELRFTDGRVETTTLAPGEKLDLPPGCGSYRWVL